MQSLCHRPFAARLGGEGPDFVGESYIDVLDCYLILGWLVISNIDVIDGYC